MNRFNIEILEIVSKKEEDKKYMARCLAVNVCPECGSDLSRESFSDGGYEYECTSCREKFRVSVLNNINIV